MPKKTTSRTQNQLVAENEDLRVRLAEAEETLRIIYSGEVDALVVSGVGGEQIFTLKGADRSYRVLIEDMSEGALTLTAEGVILYANRRFAEMLKTPLEKMIGSTIHSWIAPDSQQILQSLLRKGADEKLREQLVLITSDGTLVPAFLSINRLPTDEAPASFCLVATDLTDQKRSEAIAASETLARELLAASNQSRLALLSVIEDQKRSEEALRESEAKYRGLVAEISDGIFITDDRGALIFANPALARIHGFEHPDQLVGRTFMEFIAPSMLNEVTRYFRQVVEGEQPKVTITIELVRPDGTQAIVEVNASARQVGGKVVGTQGVVRDITERKQAAASLEQSEIRFRTLFDLSPDAVILIDPFDPNVSWPIIDCNLAACLMNGYRREELVGHSIDILNITSGTEADRIAYLKRLQEAGNFKLETFHRHKNGTLFPVEVSTTLIKLGKRELVIGIDRDITERKQAEEALRRSQEETTHANRLLLALSQAAQAVQRARTQEEVYSAIQGQVTQLGYYATGLEFTEDGQSLVLAYQNYAPDLVRKGEKLTGLSQRTFRFRPRDDGIYHKIIDKGETVFIQDTAQAVADTLPKKLRALARPITDIFKFDQSIFTPLRVGDETIGILAITGFDLTEADNPTIAAFANQAAIAIQNTRLYEQAQGEIAKRKQAEETLQKEKERVQQYLDIAGVMFLVLAADQKVILINKKGCEILGYVEQEIVGRSWFDFLPQVEKDRAGAALDQLMAGEIEPVEYYENPVLTKSGQEKIVAWHNSVLTDEAGRIIGVVSSGEDITERKHAEAALRNSEIKLRSLFAAMTDVIIVYDADGCYLEIAPTNPTNLYRPLDDMLGKTVTELLPPDRASFFLDLIRQTLKIGKITNAEYNLSFGDQVRWFSASVSPLSSNSVIWVAHDITHHKATEEALRESEKRYQNLATISPVGIFRTEKNGVTIYVNPMWCQISGLSMDEALGIGWQSAVHPEDKDNLIKDWQESIRLHRASHSEYRFVRPDGTIAWVLGQAVPEMNSENQIEGYVGTITDITERKRMEEKLEEERILLRTLIDNLPDRIYVMDVQGHKLLSNLADWQASGRKMMEDVIGKTDFDTFPPDLAEDYWALDKSVIDTGKPIINVEEPGLDFQGNPVFLLSSKVPLRDNQGKVVGLVGIGHDITEHKKWEEIIRSRNDELSALYQLSRLLADANNLESVIELVLRHAVESVHITFACLALVEDGELVRRAVYPVRALDHDFKIGCRQPLTALPGCQRVLDKNEPVILQAGSPEVGSTERETLMLDFAESVCLVPLQVADPSQNLSQVLGLLILGEVRGLKRESFTPDKVRMARSIGDQAAAALRRMLSREQAGRRLQRLASLSEIDRTIASNIDLRLSLKMILKHVSEQLEVDAADVLVFNDSLRTLEFAAGRGFRSSAIERTRLRIGEGQAGRAALERNIVQIPDVAASEVAFAQSELLKGEHITAYFAVPLITKGQIKGVLEIYHRSQLEPNEEWLDFLNSLAGQAAIAIDNVQLFDNLQHSNTELALAYDATIEGWSHALDLRDKETEGHTQRVTEMTVKLVRAFGLSEAELVQVRWGALLHDIGKLGVPDGILLKPGPLTDEEWVAMKKHPTFAYELLSPIRYLRLALDIPYCHHEKWDGTGYPRGLIGDQIPLVARIFAVVDVWDALRSDRPYRSAWTEEKVREHIRASSGTHFDPRVVDLFMQVPNLI